MASAKKCDACGEFYTFDCDETKPNGITLTWFNEMGQAANTIVRKELCPECLEKVNKVIKKEV